MFLRFDKCKEKDKFDIWNASAFAAWKNDLFFEMNSDLH
jgi:hypothetical protein